MVCATEGWRGLKKHELSLRPCAPYQFLYVFTNDIKFQVNRTAGLQLIEISMLERVGNDCYGESAISGVKAGKAYAIYAD